MCDTCTTTCPCCNLRFVDHDGRYKVCIVCWKRRKGYRLTLGDDAFRDLQFVLFEHESYLSGRDTPPKLSQERIRDLLRLCHPDKHGGSERATELTKWLLEMRNRT